MVGLVNGLPLLVIELKKPGVPMRAAFDENLTHYKQQIPALFWFDGLLGTLLQERIDRLMVQFKTSAPDFYNEYLAARTVVYPAARSAQPAEETASAPLPKAAWCIGESRKAEGSDHWAQICATMSKSLRRPRKSLPRKNARSPKRKASVFVFSAFSCGHHLWLRRESRCVHSWFNCCFGDDSDSPSG